ncbi:hypothetical protein AGOR_G00197430 [Albula goreensis]|uniref:Uncharacterized protein n=1 Tax=Albula goreensis TaxID=1534307 RepID=A0A8T3CVF5_9TELE|nr:hypothetical protein AGOR_G00197430 [Albula goreensis]
MWKVFCFVTNGKGSDGTCDSCVSVNAAVWRKFDYPCFHCFESEDAMKQHQLSAGKRFAKPLLFGALLVGMATAFYNRNAFFDDMAEKRAQERARNDARLMEVLERRQRQMEEMAVKKMGGEGR